jgi:hypothetical protein
MHPIVTKKPPVAECPRNARASRDALAAATGDRREGSKPTSLCAL